jgi:hypothetical protein
VRQNFGADIREARQIYEDKIKGNDAWSTALRGGMDKNLVYLISPDTTQAASALFLAIEAAIRETFSDLNSVVTELPRVAICEVSDLNFHLHHQKKSGMIYVLESPQETAPEVRLLLRLIALQVVATSSDPQYLQIDIEAHEGQFSWMAELDHTPTKPSVVFFPPISEASARKETP